MLKNNFIQQCILVPKLLLLKYNSPIDASSATQREVE